MQEVSPKHSKIYLKEQSLTGLAPTIGLLPPYLWSFENLYYITWRTTHPLEKWFSLFAIFSTGVQKWRGVSFFFWYISFKKVEWHIYGFANPLLVDRVCMDRIYRIPKPAQSRTRVSHLWEKWLKIALYNLTFKMHFYSHKALNKWYHILISIWKTIIISPP